MAVAGQAQDSTRMGTQLLFEVGMGGSWFTATGDEYRYLDTYWAEGDAYFGGVVLRQELSRRAALRVGVRVFSREFGSLTFDYRTPINSQQSGYTPYDQFTRMAFLGIPLAVEYRPVRWVSLSAGMQLFGVLDQTSNPWGTNHSAPVTAGPVEWLAQLDLWPLRKLGVSVRYLHQPNAIRSQQIWTTDRTYDRTTHWRTVEAGLTYMLNLGKGGK